MTQLVEQVVLGKVLRTYGDNGELIVRFYEDFAEEYSDLSEPVWVIIDSLPTPLFFKSMSARGVSKATVVFDDFDSEMRAQMLVGLEFYVNRYAAQDEINSIWRTWSDLKSLLMVRCRVRFLSILMTR